MVGLATVMNEGSYEARKSALPDRVEVRVRSERRRRWSADDKLAVVRETLRPGAVAQVVADRHGIGTGLLYTWRKQMLRAAMTGFAAVEVSPETTAMLRVTSEAESLMDATAQSEVAPSAAATMPAAISGQMEVELPTGVRLRVGADVDGSALRRVLAALAAP